MELLADLRPSMSVSEIADIAGVSRRQVTNWLSGVHRPQGAVRDHLLFIHYVVRLLERRLPAEGVEIWLHQPNLMLAGETPLVLLKRKQFEQVEAAIYDISTTKGDEHAGAAPDREPRDLGGLAITLLGEDDGPIAQRFRTSMAGATFREEWADVAGLRSPEGAAGRGELTAREVDVLRLLSSGYDQPSIAERLVISPSTVGKHIQHILEKLPARSRAEAVAIAYRRNLVGDGSLSE